MRNKSGTPPRLFTDTELIELVKADLNHRLKTAKVWGMNPDVAKILIARAAKEWYQNQ